MHDNFETPILFLIFNRTDTTERVFKEIKKIKPKKLFIASDGARNEYEEVLVNKVRNLVLGQIDWDCKIETLFRDKNLGCKYAVSGAISWFFSKVEYGIILEDDCLPSKPFFNFIEANLIKYQTDLRIWQVSGSNFFPEFTKEFNHPQLFSRYGSIWGWGTWRNRWASYDIELKEYKNTSDQYFLDRILMDEQVEIRKKQFQQILDGFDTWDYQWFFTRLVNNGLSVIPKFNYIKNIGLLGGTHPHSSNDPRICLEVSENFVDVCTDEITIYRDKLYDNLYLNTFVKKKPLIKRLKKKFESIL